MNNTKTNKTNTIKNINAYDANAKAILTEADIACVILEQSTTEFKDMKKSDILDCLDLTEDGKRIKLLPTEDNALRNGKVVYDVLFKAKVPGSNEDIGMYINLEAQNAFNSDDFEFFRAHYYLARLISRQKGETFKNSDYRNLRKVYTIWINIAPPKLLQNTIMDFHYVCDVKDLYGNIKTYYPNDPDFGFDFDMAHIIFVNLGETYTKDDRANKMLKALTLIFKGAEDIEGIPDVTDILKNDYDIILSNEEEVNNMPGFAESLIKKGIDEGIAKGVAIGARNNSVNIILDAVSRGFSLEEAYDFVEPDDEVKTIVEQKLKERRS